MDYIQISVINEEYCIFYSQSFQFQKMVKKLILLFTILILAASTCKKPDQIPGKCTQCPSSLLLVDGFCYERIRGCLNHAAGPICTECQFGYILSLGTCIREAVFFGNNNLNPAPIVPNTQKFLTFAEIEDKLGKKYGPYFGNIHQYFLNKYPQLIKGNIRSVQSITTKNGVFLSIIYSQDENLYNAQALIDLYNKIKEITFVKYSIKYSQQIRLIEIVEKIKNDLKNILDKFFVYEIQILKEEYIVDFMNEERAIQRFSVQRVSSEPIQYKSFNLKFSDLARQKVLNVFPELREQKFNPLYINELIILISIDQTVSVSIEFRDYLFIINKPIYSKEENSLIDGDFTPFTNLSDSRYLASMDYIKKQFSELQNATVLTVHSATVSGINFLISLFDAKKSDKYVIKVFHDYRGLTQFIEARKNGDNIIYQLSMDYNKDHIFLQNYLAMAKQSKVFNIPPISSVSKIIKEKIVIYRVNYDFEEFLEFQFNSFDKKVKLLSYSIEGSNLIDIAHPLIDRIKRRSPTVLINSLKTSKPEIVGEKIKQITVNQPYYKILIVVHTGTYLAVIEDKGELYLVSYNKVSDQTCFDLSAISIQSDSVVQAVDSFLKTHYPIQDFKLQSIQTQIDENLFSYRYLYSNFRLKQIQFLLEQRNNQISVLKASILDYGYQLLDQNTDKNLYNDIFKIVKNQKPEYNDPFFSEVNSTIVRSYFSTENQTIQLYINRKSNILIKSKVISSRQVSKIPSEFNLNNMVIPKVTDNRYSSQQISDIKQIVSVAVEKYPNIIDIKNKVRFAEKTVSEYVITYLILIETKKGFIKFKGYFQTLTKKIEVNSVVVTEYQKNSISTCLKYNISGACLQCPSGQFIYQFQCYAKMEGCLIQPGKICVKCDSNFVKSNYRCYKQCQIFLN